MNTEATKNTIETSHPETTTSKSPEEQEMFNLDVCFLLDTTGSMQSSIDMARNKIKTIISDLKSQYTDSEVRIAVVGYKDNYDPDQHQVFEFDTSVDAAQLFLGSFRASGGGDHPEDVNGGFRHVLALKWKKLTTKMFYHLADAPCHGKRFHTTSDSYPNGLEGDKPWEDLLKEVYDMDINYLFFDIGGNTKLMYDEFKKIYTSCGEEKAHLIFSYEVLVVNRYRNGSMISLMREMPEKASCIGGSSLSFSSLCKKRSVNMESLNSHPSRKEMDYKCSESDEKFVESTVNNAMAQMEKNISYQSSKWK